MPGVPRPAGRTTRGPYYQDYPYSDLLAQWPMEENPCLYTSISGNPLLAYGHENSTPQNQDSARVEPSEIQSLRLSAEIGRTDDLAAPGSDNSKTKTTTKATNY